MIIPLHKRLRKRAHVELALLQDEVMEILYGIENGLVLHGGTAIWRCYGGNRFSEDLDFYCQNTEALDKNLKTRIAERGLNILKYKKTENLVFSKISNGPIELRVEINFSSGKPHALRPYEKADGAFMDVFSLSEEDLVLEKIDAYKGRRFIRDIYDIYFLSSRVLESSRVRSAMGAFLSELAPPVDEENIKALIYSGAIPTFAQMEIELRRRFS